MAHFRRRVVDKSIRGIAMIESYREEGGKETYERHYYITSNHDKSAKFIAKIIRGH